MAAPTIVFDLDGTLIDTAPDLVETLNVVFVREGLSPLPYHAARNLIGGGVEAMIAGGIEDRAASLSQLGSSRCWPTSAGTIQTTSLTVHDLFRV
jgi:phosphoglycolate phosphatase-like HAD superfamily hydrolase